MERRIQMHASRLSQAQAAAPDTQFRVGQHVRTLDGFTGRVLFIDLAFSPGAESYQVELDSHMGVGNYLASQLRPVPEGFGGGHQAPAYLPAGVTAALETEADLDAHTADLDYPEMGSVLTDRPDPGRHITMIGSLHEALGPQQLKLFHMQPNPNLNSQESTRHNPSDPYGHLDWRREHDEDYEPDACEHCGADTRIPEDHAEHHENWLRDQVWHTDWDAESPGDSLHRGIGMHLPHALHAHVHDESVPVADRARALASYVMKDQAAGSSHRGLGNFWSDEPDVSKGYAETHRPKPYEGVGENRLSWEQTPVMLHVHTPDRSHFETDPDTLNYWGVHSYHISDNREVPLQNQTPLRVKGISWARPDHGHGHKHETPDHLHEDPGWTHHEFGGDGLHALAAQYADGYDQRDQDYNGEPEVGGIYWQQPAQQAFVHDELGEPEPGPIEMPPSMMMASRSGLHCSNGEQIDEHGDAPYSPAPAFSMFATTVNGTQIDDHGDAPEHGSIPRAENPDSYDSRSTEGQGDSKWDDAMAYSKYTADEVKKNQNGAAIGMYPEGIFAGGGPGIGVGPVVASEPWTSRERSRLHSWQDVPGATEGDFVPSTEFTSRYPEYVPQPDPSAMTFEAADWGPPPDPADRVGGPPPSYHPYQHLQPGHWDFQHAPAEDSELHSWGAEPEDVASLEQHRGHERRYQVMHTLSGLHSFPEDTPAGQHMMHAHGWGAEHVRGTVDRGNRLSDIHDALHETGMTNHEHTGDPAHEEQLRERFGEEAPPVDPRRVHPGNGGTQFRDPYSAIMDAVPRNWQSMHDSMPLSKMNALVPEVIGPRAFAEHIASGAIAEAVYKQLSDDYPPEAIEWVRHASWSGPHFVPFDQVDWASRQDWSSYHQPERVDHFIKRGVKKARKGKTLNPSILIAPPGDSRQRIGDGHHRALACLVRAVEGEEAPPGVWGYTAAVGAKTGPWDEMHDKQFHADSERKGGEETGTVLGPDGSPQERTDFQGKIEQGVAQFGGAPKAKAPVREMAPEPDLPAMTQGRKPKKAALRAFEAAAGDAAFRFEFVSSWRDVQAKAARMRREGKVRIVMARNSMVIAEVEGDHATYESGIQTYPGRPGSVMAYACGCPWATFHQNRDEGFSRFAGRMCSHALAVRYEASSKGMFGRAVTEDERKPGWLPHDIVVRSEPPYEGDPHKGRWAETWLAPAASLHHATPDEARDWDWTPEERDEWERAPVRSEPPYEGDPHKGQWRRQWLAPAASKTARYVTVDEARARCWEDPVYRAARILLGNREDAGHVAALMALAGADPEALIRRHMDIAHSEGLGQKQYPGGMTAHDYHDFLHERRAAMAVPHKHEQRQAPEPAAEGRPQLKAVEGAGVPDWVQSQRRDRGLCEQCGEQPAATTWSGTGQDICWDCVDKKRAAREGALLRTADQANAPWGSNNMINHPPQQPYGATSAPEKDRDPGSYGPLAGPDPENWGEIDPGSAIQMPMTNEAALLSHTVDGPSTADWIPEHQESFPYADQANTAGPSTSITARDPNGIRMEERLHAQDSPHQFADPFLRQACQHCGLDAHALVHHSSVGEPQLAGALAELKEEPDAALGPDGLTGAADGTIGGGDAGSEGPAAWGAASPALLSSWGARQSDPAWADRVRRACASAIAGYSQAHDPSVTQSMERGDGYADGAQHPEENVTQEPGMGSMDEPLAPADSSIQTIGNQQWSGGGSDSDEVAVEPGMPQGESMQDIVASFQRSAASRLYTGGGAPAGGGGGGGGGGQMGDGDIAAAAKAFLLQWSPAPPSGSIAKTADVLPPDEADELIREGKGQRARNLDLLDLKGTHYEDQDGLDDYEDDVAWLLCVKAP